MYKDEYVCVTSNTDNFEKDLVPIKDYIADSSSRTL